jgi:hypothetical protein
MQAQKTRKTRTGRPSKLTPRVLKKLTETLRSGAYRETACLYAGIDYSTFRRWEIKGEGAKIGKFREFCEAIKKAEADAEVHDLELISKAAENQWQAAAWKLERKYPAKWGRRDASKIELSGKVEGEANEQACARISALLDQLHEAEAEESEPSKKEGTIKLSFP